MIPLILLCGIIPGFARDIRVGVLLNQREVRFRTTDKLDIYRGKKRLRRIAENTSFRIWLGNVDSVDTGSPAWYVQVGVYHRHSSVDNCKAMLARFTDQEPDVHYIRKRNLYLVRYGPYAALSEASAMKDLLKLNGFDDVYMMSVDDDKPSKTPVLYLITSTYDKYALSNHSITFRSDSPAWMQGARYRGELELRIAGDRFNVINRVDIEQYLRGVVPAEMGGTLYPHIEALKAQAVAARTYVYYNLNQFQSMGFDICADQSCQVYKGMNAEQDRTDRAVEATRGEILTYQGKPINALFTAVCGGQTEDVENVFEGGPVPYLRSVSCQGGDDDWVSMQVKPRFDIPQSATSYSDRPLLDVMELFNDGLIDATILPKLNDMASLEYTRQFLTALMARLGIAVPSVEIKLDSLKGIATWLAHAIFNTDDPDELLQAGIIKESCTDIPPRVIDVITIGAQVSRTLNQAEDPGFSFKVVDEDFMKTATSPDFLFLAAGDQLIPIKEARIRFGDRVRYLEKQDGISALVILTQMSQEDVNDSFVSSYRWYRFLSQSDLTDKVDRFLKVGQVKDIAVGKTTASGRVSVLNVTGEKGSGQIKGLRVRWALGAKENKFKLFKRVDPKGQLLGIYLTGTAWGHGVGMCQVGAFGMATRGSSYRDILKHYYTGVEIENIKE